MKTAIIIELKQGEKIKDALSQYKEKVCNIRYARENGKSFVWGWVK